MSLPTAGVEQTPEIEVSPSIYLPAADSETNIAADGNISVDTHYSGKTDIKNPFAQCSGGTAIKDFFTQC